MSINELRKKIEDYHTEWCDLRDEMDKYSPEYNLLQREIDALEFVLGIIDGKIS